MKPLLDSKKVCELLGGISAATLSRMVKAGEIPYVLIRSGRRKKKVLFDEDVLTRWIASRSRGPGRSNRPIQMVNKMANTEISSANGLSSEKNLGAHRFDEPVA